MRPAVRRVVRSVVRRAVPGLVALLLTASLAAAQDRERLRERCGEGTAGAEACGELALAAEALLGGVGLTFASGSDLPGSPSTLGRRYGASPRWALSGRVGVAQFDVPALEPADPAAARGIWAPAVRADVAAGVFDGFRLAPTVGGFLALDLTATLGLAFLPGGDGFDGSAPAWGYGARVGILRESFTLPAVTLAITRRHVSGFRYGEAGAPGIEVEKLTVTSVRATAGKEFMALGILGGLGWDRARGDGLARPPAPGALQVAFDDLEASRVLIFGALTRTWLVVQGSAEAGFATGYDERPGGRAAGGAYDPTGGSFFAGLSLRILY